MREQEPAEPAKDVLTKEKSERKRSEESSGRQF
jgi:hypothetical protein